jgi:hypothetical protein
MYATGCGNLHAVFRQRITKNKITAPRIATDLTWPLVFFAI